MSLHPEVKLRARGDTVRQYRWYFEHASVEVADCYLKAVDSAIRKLSERPHWGVLCRFRAARFRGFRYIPLERPFDVFLLFYRFDSTTLEVMRVLHGARDIPRRLREIAPTYGAAPPTLIGSSVSADIMETMS